MAVLIAFCLLFLKDHNLKEDINGKAVLCASLTKTVPQLKEPEQLYLKCPQPQWARKQRPKHNLTSDSTLTQCRMIKVLFFSHRKKKVKQR